MSTIRFEIRKDKKDKDGQVPIRLVYQVRGQRKYYSTGKKLPSDNWSDIDQQAVYIKKGALLDLEIKKINTSLAEIVIKIGKIEDRFVANAEPYDAEKVIEELSQADNPIEKRGNSSKEVYAFIDKYIEDNQHSRVKGSLSVYRSLKRHLEGYEQKSKAKVTFEKIDYAFFRSFQNHLFSLTKKDKEGKTVKALNDITIAKQLSTLKTFLNYAREHHITVSDQYQSFKIKRDSELEVIALTRDEFETIYNLDLSGKPALAQVRDVFCFSCATGLRYSDLKQLRREHIGVDFIDLTAVKTGHKTKIPINPFSRAILEKYAADAKPLPVISNQKSNEHLAEICRLAGLDTPIEIVRKYGNQRKTSVYPKHELVRMHCGRKTFATLSLENKMSAEHVMKIGGWKDYKSFKRYINVTDESAKGAMEQAWGAASIKPKLKVV